MQLSHFFTAHECNFRLKLMQLSHFFTATQFCPIDDL